MNRHLNLLVVEDVDIAQKIASFILTDLGHAVDIAPDGEKALEMFQKNAYDLIFMDIGLPGIDGMQATRAIRQLEDGTSHTPIIALTANYDTSHKPICLESGMDEFLSKPLSKEKATAMLDQFVQ